MYATTTTTRAATISPIRCIETADELIGHAAELHAKLAKEVAEIQADWRGLCAVGGGREDHAASLLQSVVPRLDAIIGLASRAKQQVLAAKADPFGCG